MITYEKYAEFRNLKGLKDSDICRMTGIPQSTFSEWKNGKYTPKYDKMSKIAEAVGMDYNAFVGQYGLWSGLNPNKPNVVPHVIGMMAGETPEKEQESEFDKRLLRLYHNATPETQKNVMILLENSQKEAEISSLSSKEA